MYQPAPNLLAYLIAASSFGAIIISVLLVMAATQESRSPNGDHRRVKSDGVMGVRLIVAGAMVLVAYAGWRLF